MKNYILNQKVKGWEYKTRANSFNEAVKNIYSSLINYGWTLKEVEENLIEEPSKNDWDQLDRDLIRERAFE